MSLPIGPVKRNGAVVSISNGLADGQPQTGARLLRPQNTVKRVKDTASLGLRNPRAVVDVYKRQNYGLGNLLLATIGSGVILFLMGLFKLGSFIRFIPVSIVIGFTNGIAVLIGLSQVKDFLGLTIEKMPADFFHQIQTLYAHIDTFNPYAFGLALVSFLIVKFWPKGYVMGEMCIRDRSQGGDFGR